MVINASISGLCENDSLCAILKEFLKRKWNNLLQLVHLYTCLVIMTTTV